MYNPDLGTFLSRDPLPYDPNLYRYCGNNPVKNTDPSGLYTMEWGNEWTDTEKSRINASLARVQSQCKKLSQAIQNEITEVNKLGFCVMHRLRPMLHSAKYVFDSVAAGIASQDNLEMYHYAFNDPTISGLIRVGFWPVMDPQIELNDDNRADWHNLSDRTLDRLMFHELSHKYGTTDSTDIMDYNSALVLEFSFYDSGPFLGNAYQRAKCEAMKDCGKLS